MWADLIAAVMRIIVAPFVWMWAGATWAKRRAAERALKQDQNADARDEGIRRLDDADLDERVRRSME